MLTQDQVLEAVKLRSRDNQRQSCDMLDARDYSRLSEFFPVEDWEVFGFKLKDGAEKPAITPWTEENIKSRMAKDLDFAFDKALGQRGISASLMYETMKTWMWVLGDEELSDFDNYPMYGLPLLKAISVKYGLSNPIGDDTGSEPHYGCD